jgi:hypothetical protein
MTLSLHEEGLRTRWHMGYTRICTPAEDRGLETDVNISGAVLTASDASRSADDATEHKALSSTAFQHGEVEECRFLGCYAVWLL